MLIRKAIAASLAMWMHFHGAIAGKHAGDLVRQITLNEIQIQVVEIIRYCEEHHLPCRIVGLKARQVGLSTISIAAAYWKCRRERTNFLLIGDEYEKSVANLERMFHIYAKNDTFDWGNKYDERRKTVAPFSNGSMIVTDTANDERAGASGTFQVAVFTEAAHFKSSKQIDPGKVLEASLACIPDDSGIVIIESTANGTGNAYHQIWQGAMWWEDFLAWRESGKPRPPGWNGYIKVFLAWHHFPEYTTPVTAEQAAVIEATKSKREEELLRMFPKSVDYGRLQWRRETIASPKYRGNETRFEQEYPSDPDTAFLVTGERVFSPVHLKIMETEADKYTPEYLVLDWTSDSFGRHTASPRKVAPQEAWLKQWEAPRVGYRYSISADTMTGASQTTGADPDNHGVKVWREGFHDANMRWWPKRMVARLADCGEELSSLHNSGRYLAACRWDIDILCERIERLCRYYGSCMICPEENGDRGLIKYCRDNGLPLYHQMKWNQVTEKEEPFWGWRTTPHNRETIISELVRRVREWVLRGDDRIEIYDRYVLAEFAAFARLPSGRSDAMAGWHDDTVMSSAIGCACEGASTMMRERTAKPTDELEARRARKGLPSRGRNRTHC